MADEAQQLEDAIRATAAFGRKLEQLSTALAEVQELARAALSSSVFPSNALARIDALCDDALWTPASSEFREGDVF